MNDGGGAESASSNRTPVGSSNTPDCDATGTDLLATLDRVAERAGRVAVSCTYQCHSGGTFGGEWRGVAVADLLAEADPETTHLLAVSADGYCVPVPVVTALETVVATESMDDATEAGDSSAGAESTDDGSRGDDPNAELPRLVGDDLDSSETVRNLARLVPVALPAGADPEPTFLDRELVPRYLDGESDSRRTVSEVVG